MLIARLAAGFAAVCLIGLGIKAVVPPREPEAKPLRFDALNPR